MARTSKKAGEPKAEGKPAGAASAARAAPEGAPADRIIDALLALAGEDRFEEITLTQISSRAGVTRGEFR